MIVAITAKPGSIFVAFHNPGLMRAVRALAQVTGRREAEVVEDALRRYLAGEPEQDPRRALRQLLTRAPRPGLPDEDVVLDLASQELHLARAARA